MRTMQTLLATLPQRGQVTWIGLRPAPFAPLQVVDAVEALAGRGLRGDRASEKWNAHRQVTLLQTEHLAVLAAFLHQSTVDPALLRRNILIAGINLLALKDKTFQIGEAIFSMTGLCHPCSRMETNLGTGGYNAMRGHGGILAKVIQGGWIRCGDAVYVLDSNSPTLSG